MLHSCRCRSRSSRDVSPGTNTGGSRRHLCVALLDIDGVIRDYEPPTSVEARWRLAPGAIAAAAFEPTLLRRLTTGALTRVSWVREIGERVGSQQAAVEWASRPGLVDRAVIAVIDDLRSTGCRVVLFSNGSDELAAELAALDVPRHVDGVVNSAELGLAKPDPAAFAAACELVGSDPRCTAFVDDSQANVDAAARVGMTAHRYTDVDSLQEFLSSVSSATASRPDRQLGS